MAATAQAPAGRPRRRVKPLLFFILFLILAGGAAGGYVWMTLHVNYSDGERAGFIQKFSRRGWVCKTWEGELLMVSMPGTAAELFKFSVRDPAVATQLNQLIGQRVHVHYEQHKGVPSDCFGESEYYVTQAQLVK